MEKKFLGSTGLAKFLEKLYDVFSEVGHTHTKSQITDFPTVPTNTSQLTNDSGFVTADEVDSIITVDSALSGESENPVQNKVIKSEFDKVSSSLEAYALRDELLELDATLGVQGAAADSKAVGDAISAIDTYVAFDENSDGNVELGGVPQGEIVTVPVITEAITATLTSSAWSASDVSGFIQTITVPGLTDEKKAKAYPAQPTTLAEKLALAEETAKVRACSRSGNKMTFECWEEQPALDIPVIVEVYV